MPVRRWFPFVQLEFTHGLGPSAGRYVLEQLPDPRERELAWDQSQRGVAAIANREGATAETRRVAQAEARDRAQERVPAGAAARAHDDEPAPTERVPVRTLEEEQEALLGTADVLVLQIHGAPAAKRGLFGKRSAKSVKDSDEPGEVALNVATFIRGREMLEDARAGDRLLSGIDHEAWAADAVRDMNRAIAAYRVSAADPYCFEISRMDPRAIRVGYGIAEEVFAGRWSKAVLLPPPPAPRLSRAIRLAPSQGTAALLAGQTRPLEAEELVLRALLDIDQGRLRAAAVGLQSALDLLLGELGGERLPGQVRMQVDQVAELRQPLSVLASQARREPLGATARDALTEHAEQIGATIDRWRYEPLGY